MRCDALCMVRVFRVRLLLFSSAMRLSVALVGVKRKYLKGEEVLLCTRELNFVVINVLA